MSVNVTHFSSMPQQQNIIHLAQRVEPDISLLDGWWNNTGIVELDYMTPNELVQAGKTDVLERFLQSILRGDRE